jgi:outer membrane murein-binding lipoprotein Lpp
MRHAWNAVAAVVIVAPMLGAAGCSSSASSEDSSAGSRATLYHSIDELAADSTALVSGVVADQFTEGDTTVSVIPVDNAPFSLDPPMEDELKSAR